MSLFSLTEIDDYEKKINRRIMTNENKNYNYGIGVMEAKLKQMKNTVKAINAPTGGRLTIHYRFTCDTGKTGKCTERVVAGAGAKLTNRKPPPGRRRLSPQ